MFQAVNAFGQQYPILAIIIILWSILGVMHYIKREYSDNIIAIFYTILEGPAIWIKVVLATFWNVFVIYPIVRFVRFIKSIN